MQKAHETRHCPINAVIFDMDNTLFDFVEAKLSACRAIIQQAGLKNEPVELLKYFLRPVHGFESHEHIRDFLKNNGIFTDELFDNCCKIYDEKKLDGIRPYPHIQNTLAALKRKGLVLAIVTDAQNGNAKKLLMKAGLDEYFDCIISADLSGASKPSPEPFLLALSTLGMQPENTVLVGDSLRRDIEPGKKIGMVTIHAVYGDRNFHESNACVPDFSAENAKDIEKIVTAMNCK
jgi:putative hydrolase of the HAD superfamily